MTVSGRTIEEIRFRPPDVAPVVERMRQLAAAGGGWVNLQPAIVEDEQPPPPRGMAILFGANPQPVPVCTWVPGRAGRKERVPDQVGVQHGMGSRVLAQLAADGLPLPHGWRWQQDNPRRGVVVELPLGTDPADALAWLLQAGERLAAVSITGEWRALVHPPRTAR